MNIKTKWGFMIMLFTIFLLVLFSFIFLFIGLSPIDNNGVWIVIGGSVISFSVATELLVD